MCERIVNQDARVAAAEAEEAEDAEEEKKRERVEEWKDRNPGMGIPDKRPAAAQNDALDEEEELKRARGFPPKCATCYYECPSCGELSTFRKSDVKRYQIVCT